MTGPDPDEGMRDVAREVLGELVRDLLGDAPANPRVNGHADTQAPPRPAPARDDAAIVPQVPAPPVAAVLRPSTWGSPAAPGEVIGDRTPAPASEPRSHPSGSGSPAAALSAASASGRLSMRTASAANVASDSRVEPVTIDTDEDLERFVRALVARVENPRDRLAIRAGRLRFALRRSATTPVADTDPGGTQVAAVHVLKGAVTERAVRAAAAEGARVVLARGAVLTPLARDCASALGVEIERERRC